MVFRIWWVCQAATCFFLICCFLNWVSIHQNNNKWSQWIIVYFLSNFIRLFVSMWVMGSICISGRMLEGARIILFIVLWFPLLVSVSVGVYLPLLFHPICLCWNLNFFRNLNDREANELAFLLSILDEGSLRHSVMRFLPIHVFVCGL